MVSSGVVASSSPVFDVAVSSTVPSKSSGDREHDLGAMDLAMKAHYLKAVYLFRKEAVAALTKLEHFKHPTAPWLDVYYMACARVRRRPDTGRPFLRCNDAGVRYTEASCSKTVDEWVGSQELMDRHNDDLLYWDRLGPRLSFSPLVYLLITRFKCGGAAIGMSWAHVLGDAPSAIAFMNLYGEFLSGHRPEFSLKPPPNPRNPASPAVEREPLSVKRADPVGDHWVVRGSLKMETHTFGVAAEQIERIRRAAAGGGNLNSNHHFHLLAAIIWKCMARIRGDRAVKAVSVCWGGTRGREREAPGNRQRIGVAEAGPGGAAGATVWELAERIAEGRADETDVVEAMTEREKGGAEWVVYGGRNLTFLDLEEAAVYGMVVGGHRPSMVSYSIDGVGDEGAVVVLPSPETGADGCGGRKVSVSLPRDEVAELKEMLREWGI